MRKLFTVKDESGDGYGLFATWAEAHAETERISGLYIEAVDAPDDALTLAELEALEATT
jgi:hypothetical protein